MIYRHFIGAFLILYGGVAFAQSGGAAERSAMKLMEKHRWQKVETKLRKAIAKDSLNPSVRYLISVFYFRADNPAYQLDSAYRYAVGALDDYALSPGREREKLKRMLIDSARLTALRARIDSTAFEEARKANTETAYLNFLSQFPSAVQRDLAEDLRDEVAYQDALQQNTYKAFLSYLTRYPGAHREQEARAHYDRLLYLEETKDQRLASYEKFLAEHPETPYRSQIYRHIFEISTADGSVASFLAFMTRYPISDLAKKARQLLFHILAEQENPKWPDQFLNDSLRHLLQINQRFLVPVLKNNLYGFIDGNGQEMIAPLYTSIHPEYLCGHIVDEALQLDNKLYTRSGSVIYNGKVTEVTELGTGFLQIDTDSGMKIIHKAGFLVQDSVEGCRVLSRTFIAVRKNNAWYLRTLTGRLLDATGWDDITELGNVIVFKRDNKSYVALREQLSKCADGIPLRLSEPFDEIKLWPKDLLWGKAGDFQGLLNQGLHGVIGFDRHRLTQTFFGALAEKQNGYALYNWDGKRSASFDRVNIFDPWVTVKENKAWYLFDPRLMRTVSKAYDTIRAEGPFLVGRIGDAVHVHFTETIIVPFFKPGQMSFIPGKDSTSFLVVHDNAQGKSVYDRRGRKLFSGYFDAIEYAGQGVFAVTRRDKKGLVNMAGALLLPPEYDAIGSASEQVISLLKNKRFGAYHIEHKKLIKPQYDRNILPYTANLISTFRNGHYGFLGWDNKPVSDFVFDEIKYWDDSTALVRQGSFWNFYEIFSGKNSESNLRNITMIRNTVDEKIAVIQKDRNYGVISNKRNVVIPLTFSDIVNLGSAEQPLYFTEKHIREASLFIVIYYNEAGEMLRKEIYDEAADYDKIYCTDN